AEEILGQARAALRPSGDPLSAELAEADTALAFARRQFNESAQVYNRAVSQFPTWVIAGLFGFRKAGTL
ncbi:MAG TPA: LemA family protein, partial [Piscinibacter sp.]|nr:LemA family protein [Piscinibacter sp.]